MPGIFIDSPGIYSLNRLIRCCFSLFCDVSTYIFISWLPLLVKLCTLCPVSKMVAIYGKDTCKNEHLRFSVCLPVPSEQQLSARRFYSIYKSRSK